MNCPACGLYPYATVDVGIGVSIPVGVDCCTIGVMIFERGFDLETAEAYMEIKDAEYALDQYLRTGEIDYLIKENLQEVQYESREYTKTEWDESFPF